MDISTGHMVLVSTSLFYHEMKAYARPHVIFSMWHFNMYGQPHAVATLSQGKSPQHPLDMRLGGPHGWSGHGGKERNPYNPKTYRTGLMRHQIHFYSVF
jgi:hypothetical protein